MSKILQIAKKIAPRWLVKLFRNQMLFEVWETESYKKSNPFLHEPDVVSFDSSPMTVGIIYGSMQYHRYWIMACKDLKVSYKIIYLERADWQEQIRIANCDIFLVWPDIRTQEIKLMQDERLRIMVQEMGQRIYPNLMETWLYENKRVQHYWLKQHGFPIPDTKVFYNADEAVDWLVTAQYPLVFKSNLGASASGVYIVKSSQEAVKMAKRFLKDGYAPKRNAAGKKQKGSLFVQAFLPGVKEWRMVRIGESYFGHGKEMKGLFHSGSGKANWDMPPSAAFDLLIAITEKGGFTSMDVDIFEDAAGNLYVNELQTVFGNSVAKEQMRINGIPGRYVLDETGAFKFEAGSFCENHLCNLRLQELMKPKNAN